jgi:hypothetical protein
MCIMPPSPKLKKMLSAFAPNSKKTMSSEIFKIM